MPFAEILATGLFNATGNASEDTKRAHALLRELKEIIEAHPDDPNIREMLDRL